MKNILIGTVVGLVIGGLVGFWLASPHMVAGAIPSPSGPTSNVSWLQASISVDSPLLRLGTFSTALQTFVPTATTTVVTAPFVLSTTTPAVIPNPFLGGPSLLNWVVCTLTAATTSTSFVLGTTTSAFATTTGLVGSTALAANAAAISWDGGVNNNVIGSTTDIVLGTTGAVFGGPGYCSAQFTQF